MTSLTLSLKYESDPLWQGRLISHELHTCLLSSHHPNTGAVLPGRAANLHLSESGKEQAVTASLHIKDAQESFIGKKVSAVYASPMERTRETAAPIAKAVGRRVRIAEGLIECDFGKWTGRKLKDLFKLKDWRTVQSQPSQFRFPGGESFLKCKLVLLQVSDLVSKLLNRNYFCVSHADLLRLLCYSIGSAP